MPAGSGFTLLVVGSLVGLEVAGRFAPTDLHDALAGLLLLGVGAAVAMRHRREPLPWLQRLGQWLTRLASSAEWLRQEHGFDLRGSPPLPRKTPRAVWVLIALLVAWGGLAAAAWIAFPTGWRALGVHSSYVLYLTGLMLLWTMLGACAFVGLKVPLEALNRLLRDWIGDTDRRGAELAALVFYTILVAFIAWVIPPTAVLILCLTVAAVALAVYWPCGKEGPALLWRSHRGAPVYAVPLHRAIAVVALILALLIFDLLLTSCGGRLVGVPPTEDTMPGTALLGAVAAWLVPGMVLVGAVWFATAWRSDPARQSPPTVHVSGSGLNDRRRAAESLRTWGWKVRMQPALRESGTVGIELVPPIESEAEEFDPRWPLRLSQEDLAAGMVRSRLERRDEIQVRRQFFRGLAKLFKRAGSFKGPGGGGYWLAPHWWFIDGLARDDSDGGDEDAPPPLVGPPFHRTLPARSRQHFYRVLRATQVDMIFVEDGISYRKLEKVLRVLLELFDVHGGQRKAEEQHFRGLPKVRVMIHEYEPGNPFQSELYPEPKWDELSRVRVLHIFRDRGGHEEEVEPPYDFSWTPAPVSMMS